MLWAWLGHGNLPPRWFYPSGWRKEVDLLKAFFEATQGVDSCDWCLLMVTDGCWTLLIWWWLLASHNVLGYKLLIMMAAVSELLVSTGAVISHVDYQPSESTLHIACSASDVVEVSQWLLGGFNLWNTSLNQPTIPNMGKSCFKSPARCLAPKMAMFPWQLIITPTVLWSQELGNIRIEGVPGIAACGTLKRFSKKQLVMRVTDGPWMMVR